jgi:hypothetical protein
MGLGILCKEDRQIEFGKFKAMVGCGGKAELRMEVFRMLGVKEEQPSIWSRVERLMDHLGTGFHSFLIKSRVKYLTELLLQVKHFRPNNVQSW